ncbi:MAG: hypothetical protein N2Z21_08415, partial [Candidatus Sumerlaeaceae bacterium]|nr:hypothetical protein [Candidatus Sumerlaeaceae bacterium]
VVSGLAVNLILAPSQPVEKFRLLVSGKPLVFTPADLQLYDTIRHQTAPQAKFVTNAEHWGLPLFTGRCEFARGPVPAFGLHGLPSQTVYYLFSLRENFVHGTQCNKYWQVIETFTPVEYVIVENIAKPASQTLMRCLEDAVFDKGRFRKLWETPNAVTYRWVVEPTYE